mmetsp:Transcript_7805/g.32257  ORF Transcript_7805/g.32257 Transcript_7805/m.32257 type:complete len:253 (+) Transcript_7805:1457-2215(+)
MPRELRDDVRRRFLQHRDVRRAIFKRDDGHHAFADGAAVKGARRELLAEVAALAEADVAERVQVAHERDASCELVALANTRREPQPRIRLVVDRLDRRRVDDGARAELGGARICCGTCHVCRDAKRRLRDGALRSELVRLEVLGERGGLRRSDVHEDLLGRARRRVEHGVGEDAALGRQEGRRLEEAPQRSVFVVATHAARPRGDVARAERLEQLDGVRARHGEDPARWQEAGLRRGGHVTTHGVAGVEVEE